MLRCEMWGCTQRWAHHVRYHSDKCVLKTLGAVGGFGLEQFLAAGQQVEVCECFSIQLQLFLKFVFVLFIIRSSEVLLKL